MFAGEGLKGVQYRKKHTVLDHQALPRAVQGVIKTAFLLIVPANEHFRYRLCSTITGRSHISLELTFRGEGREPVKPLPQGNRPRGFYCVFLTLKGNRKNGNKCSHEDAEGCYVHILQVLLYQMTGHGNYILIVHVYITLFDSWKIY